MTNPPSSLLFGGQVLYFMNLIKTICSALACCIAVTLSGQTISGTVTDATSGEALIGVNIIEQGTSNGTITDIDGSYALAVSSADVVLVISYVGYSTEYIKVDGRSTVNVTISEDAQQLDEVVVIGYGTQKKKEVTGAISKVEAVELEDMQITRLEGALQGRTSGVNVVASSGQPGSASTVRVRGRTTFGNSDPLYVVDGVIINGGIDFLNANDIESIEVLKDAASASIYGTRSANGVILVTTKKGKEGTMRVNLNTFYGTQRPWRKLAVLNATEYATLRNESRLASGQPILFDNPREFGEGTDWQDAVFAYDSPTQNHEISISGANEKSDYFFSAGILDQQGIVAPDDSQYRRYTARINMNHKVTDRFRFGTSAAYARVKAAGVSTNSEFGSPLSRALNMDPITPVVETDPDRAQSFIYTSNPVVRDADGNPYGISTSTGSEVLNPVAALEVQQGFGSSDKVVASIFGEYDITKNITYRASANADLAFFGGEGFTPIFYLNATNINPVTSYNRSLSNSLYRLVQHTVSYDIANDGHKFSALAGASNEKTAGKFNSITILNLPVNSLEQASFGFASTPEDQRAGGGEFDVRTTSLFGRLNYGYKERYLISATLRRDGSSRFGPNNRFGYFPGVSVGWVMSDEDFINNSGFLKFLKMRASYGVTGNDQIGDFGFLARISTGSNYTFGENDDLTIGATAAELANPDLRWERTTQVNIGFDGRFLKGGRFALDFYDKITTDILQRLEVPTFVGFPNPTANIGEMQNRGIELELGYEWDVSTDLGFDLSANASYNQNEVLKFNDESDFRPGSRVGPQGIEVTRDIVGQPLAQHFGFKTDGLFQNMDEINAYTNAEGELLQPNASPGDIRFVDFNGDGILDIDDRTTLGQAIPSFTYGLNFTAFYKEFDFTLFGSGAAGSTIYNATRRYDLPGTNLPASALGRWTGEGTSNSFPRLTDVDPNNNFTNSSDFFVESGNFFRVRNLQLGYTMTERAASRVGMSKARFYLSVNNAFTITNYSGYDPEIGNEDNVDRGIYPQARAFILGANITFK